MFGKNIRSGTCDRQISYPDL
ncbi:protein of unknown function [Burkholderia multivorans]